MAKSKPIPKGLPEFKPGSRRKPKASRMYKEPAGPVQPIGPGLPGSPEGFIGPIDIPGRVRAGKVKKVGKMVGLGALAALTAGAGVKGLQRLVGADEDSLMRKALFDIQGQDRQDRLAGLTKQAQEESYGDSIQRNLAQVQRYAPELYAQVAAGRRLPQGAVVLGGAARQDLLNELGRAMSDGRFSR